MFRTLLSQHILTCSWIKPTMSMDNEETLRDCDFVCITEMEGTFLRVTRHVISNKVSEHVQYKKSASTSLDSSSTGLYEHFKKRPTRKYDNIKKYPRK